ncbi:hypothetical protein DH2020_045318 [Rehmannia glutinosa]|uniref:RNase H type-1 domain-containing protein n=1 Tax=Rehmannia glutinosa TaxID=99300 RepID=A0ABR0UEH7_REHGL
MKQGRSDGDSLFAMLLWGIWWSRNQMVFQGRQLTQQQVMSQVNMRLEEHKSADTRQRLTTTITVSETWEPAEPGTYKLNTDASIREGVGTSIGIVIRDFHGQTYQSLIQHLSNEYEVDVVEAIACREGLIFARNLGLKVVVIKTDITKLFYKLRKKAEYLSYFGNIVAEIFDLFSAFDFVCPSLVKRSENSVSHLLACHAFFFLIRSR